MTRLLRFKNPCIGKFGRQVIGKVISRISLLHTTS